MLRFSSPSRFKIALGACLVLGMAALIGGAANDAAATPVVYCSAGGIDLVATGCISGAGDGYYSNTGGGDPVAAVEEQIFLATGTHVDLTQYGKSDSNAALFSFTPASGGSLDGSKSGTWQVLDGTDIAYITIKAANSFALYQFDPTSTGFYTTAGMLNNGGQQPGVSHISFWTAQRQQVPEPAALVLFAFGLAVLGAASIYRRQRQAV